jgi:phosphatidylserine/phosphatidylglycerophosphate/cardiolipin synthase-like enzyme
MLYQQFRLMRWLLIFRYNTEKTTSYAPILPAVVLVFGILLSACTPPIKSIDAPPVPLPLPTVTPSPIGFELIPYFTDPAAQGKDTPGKRIIDRLVEDINNATQSVDVAMYNFSLTEIGTALLHAAQRGVLVRMVVDSDALDGKELRSLNKTAVKILGDRRENLMHHKFVVIDQQILWTGSLNLTSSGAFEDENVLARIQSRELAANYAVKFNAMFVEDKFGPESRARTTKPRMTLAGIEVENYFSPEDSIDTRLISLVENARESVDILAYSFTLDRLADALIRARRNGVAVRGVFDEDSTLSNQGADFSQLQKAGLDVHLDGDDGLMHSKAIIIDGKIVAFGSYNFTASAENKNDENILIIADPQIADSFEQTFERIYQNSKP